MLLVLRLSLKGGEVGKRFWVVIHYDIAPYPGPSHWQAWWRPEHDYTTNKIWWWFLYWQFPRSWPIYALMLWETKLVARSSTEPIDCGLNTKSTKCSKSIAAWKCKMEHVKTIKVFLIKNRITGEKKTRGVLPWEWHGVGKNARGCRKIWNW